MGVRSVDYRFTRVFTGIRRPRRTSHGTEFAGRVEDAAKVDEIRHTLGVHEHVVGVDIAMNDRRVELVQVAQDLKHAAEQALDVGAGETRVVPDPRCQRNALDLLLNEH